MFNKLFTIAMLLAVSTEARRSRRERSSGNDWKGWGNRGVKTDDLPEFRDQDRFQRTNLVPTEKILEAALEADENEDVTPKFMTWTNLEHKSYKTGAELDNAKKNWEKNNETIRNLNRANRGKKNAAKYGHNQFSDESEADRDRRKGLKADENRRMLSVNNDEHRELQSVTLTGSSVDHSAYMGGIKDQGYCGSCWAFAGNSVLQGTLNRNGATGNPQVSEQMPVECCRSQAQSWFTGLGLGSSWPGAWSDGCNGGHYYDLWRFYENLGFTLAGDYDPYNESDAGSCDYNPNSTGVFDVTGQVWINDNPQAVLNALQSSPLAVAIASGPGDDFYQSGIVTSATHTCASGLNHAVSLIGYYNGSEGGSSPGDDCDPNGTTEQCTTEITTEPVETQEMWCRYRQWYDDYYGGSSGCYWYDEFMYYGYCCWYETVTEMVETETTTCEQVPNDCSGTSSGGSSSGSGDVPYWTIQNSWGTGWGENGTIRYAVEGGDGICGLYLDVQQVFTN